LDLSTFRAGEEVEPEGVLKSTAEKRNRNPKTTVAIFRDDREKCELRDMRSARLLEQLKGS
jgi:hypothetical protein